MGNTGWGPDITQNNKSFHLRVAHNKVSHIRRETDKATARPRQADVPSRQLPEQVGGRSSTEKVTQRGQDNRKAMPAPPQGHASPSPQAPDGWVWSAGQRVEAHGAGLVGLPALERGSGAWAHALGTRSEAARIKLSREGNQLRPGPGLVGTGPGCSQETGEPCLGGRRQRVCEQTDPTAKGTPPCSKPDRKGSFLVCRRAT